MDKEKSEYLEWKKPILSNPNSYRSYRLWIERFQEFVCKKIEWITLSDMARFTIYLQEKFAPKNVEYGMSLIHNYFTFHKGIGKNCLSPTLIRVPRCRGETKRPTDRHIFEQVIAAMPLNEWISLRDNIITRILYDTGCRISEALAIDFKNLDEYSALVPNKKTREFKRIYWSEATHKLLFERYIPIRININAETDALFVSKYGECTTRGRLGAKNYQRNLREVCKRLDIEGITAHSFRHGKAHAILNQKGGTVIDVAHILGHSNPASSFKYLKLTSLEAEERAKKYLV